MAKNLILAISFGFKLNSNLKQIFLINAQFNIVCFDVTLW